MLRQLTRRSVTLLAVAALAMVSGCGVKGPLVPAPTAKTAAPPPAPTFPPATVPGNPEQRKP
ncbi:MAG TPA: lipoprotein [Casimicrobiaceae bacterium]|nr:lipoprotein [Casimicrobiaceae bacterium]